MNDKEQQILSKYQTWKLYLDKFHRESDESQLLSVVCGNHSGCNGCNGCSGASGCDNDYQKSTKLCFLGDKIEKSRTEKEILDKYQIWQPHLKDKNKLYNEDQLSIYNSSNGCVGCSGCGVETE